MTYKELAQAEAAIPTPTPTTWFPSRKVIAGGIAGVFSWLILYLLKRYANFDPQPIMDQLFQTIGTPAPAVQPALAGVIAWIVAYVTPVSVKDIVSRLNDDIVRVAAADPKSAVSEKTVVLPPGTKVVAASVPATAVIFPPALKKP